MMSLAFSQTISRDVLEAYLARAASMADAIHSNTLNDDLRMIANLRPKFLGRAACYWHPTEDDEAHFALARAFADRVHAVDPEIICQVCIFEAIYEQVDRIPIPAWVFEAFGLPVERRNFSYAAIAGEVFPAVYHWSKLTAGRSTVPDITQLEAQLWFYYRARRYLEAGYEALHMGQVHMYAGRDRGYRVCRELFARIRQMARTYARRGLVLLDAHTHGISHRGHTLFDFNSRPLSPLNVPEVFEQVRLVRHGRSLGGITPSGWSCDDLPFLWEIDNYGGYAVPPEQFADHALRAKRGWWGYDDIAWFAHRCPADRAAFLEYAYRWTAATDPASFFQVPLRRGVGRALVDLRHHDGHIAPVGIYKANACSAACPDGFGDEEIIKALWAKPPFRREPDPAPAPRTCDPATGLDFPEIVTLVGTLQQALGLRLADPHSAYTRMRPVAPGRYRWTGVLPSPGTCEFFIAVGGTHTETCRANGLASGPNFQLTTTYPNTLLQVDFDYLTKETRLHGKPAITLARGPSTGQAAGSATP